MHVNFILGSSKWRFLPHFCLYDMTQSCHKLLIYGMDIRNDEGDTALVCCSVLQSVAECCSVLQCVAVCCSVLQCAAVCCSVLHMTRRFIATHYNGCDARTRVTRCLPPVHDTCNTLQHTATHCNTLQHTALHPHTHTHTHRVPNAHEQRRKHTLPRFHFLRASRISIRSE